MGGEALDVMLSWNLPTSRNDGDLVDVSADVLQAPLQIVPAGWEAKSRKGGDSNRHSKWHGNGRKRSGEGLSKRDGKRRRRESCGGLPPLVDLPQLGFGQKSPSQEHT